METNECVSLHHLSHSKGVQSISSYNYGPILKVLRNHLNILDVFLNRVV